jgi:glycolate oxidase FAD binding subunit
MAHAEVPQLALELASFLGPQRVRYASGDELGVAELIIEPASLEEIAELIRKCETDQIDLAPVGACRTLPQLRSHPVRLGVSLVRLKSVVAYEPDDMTCVVQSGATLGTVNRLAAPHRQHLPLDPRDLNLTTIGALIAASQAGPLRLSEGTVRDLLIGIQFVGHSGRIVRAGGRVVKNVAGYDLMKLMTGSFGTLGIITEACFKMRPQVENYALMVAEFAGAGEAFEMAMRLHQALPLTHLELLSARPGRQFDCSRNYCLLAGFAGNEKELDYQIARARGIWDGRVMREGEAARAYERLRDLKLPGALQLQIATLPGNLQAILDSASVDFRAHVGVGVAQISFPEINDQDELLQTVAAVRDLVSGAHGHSRVIKMPAAVRGKIEAFDSPPSGAMKLMTRVKSTFDPRGIFNPGCFVGAL